MTYFPSASHPAECLTCRAVTPHQFYFAHTGRCEVCGRERPGGDSIIPPTPRPGRHDTQHAAGPSDQVGAGRVHESRPSAAGPDFLQVVRTWAGRQESPVAAAMALDSLLGTHDHAIETFARYTPHLTPSMVQRVLKVPTAIVSLAANPALGPAARDYLVTTAMRAIGPYFLDPAYEPAVAKARRYLPVVAALMARGAVRSDSPAVEQMVALSQTQTELAVEARTALSHLTDLTATQCAELLRMEPLDDAALLRIATHPNSDVRSWVVGAQAVTRRVVDSHNAAVVAERMRAIPGYLDDDGVRHVILGAFQIGATRDIWTPVVLERLFALDARDREGLLAMASVRAPISLRAALERATPADMATLTHPMWLLLATAPAKELRELGVRLSPHHSASDRATVPSTDGEPGRRER
jgi:hypothetical protein